jgi:hypothetical protein
MRWLLLRTEADIFITDETKTLTQLSYEKLAMADALIAVSSSSSS